MRGFAGGLPGRLLVLRLDPGDDVLRCLTAFIAEHNIADGAVVSAIGTLDNCLMHMVTTTGYPPVEHFERWENTALELASIDGIIADGTPHLHAVVSDKEKAYAGHLEEGCTILYLGEIVIQEYTGMALKRVKNERDIYELVERQDG